MILSIKQTISLILFRVLVGTDASAQEFPAFLEGTWRVEQGNSYEHWDLVEPHFLMGFMFSMEDGLPVVSEYLEIEQKEEAIIYKATVLDQNLGEGIPFTLFRSDSVWSFENLEHDFPKLIRYKPLGDHAVSVYVGTGERGFELKLIKISPSE